MNAREYTAMVKRIEALEARVAVLEPTVAGSYSPTPEFVSEAALDMPPGVIMRTSQVPIGAPQHTLTSNGPPIEGYGWPNEPDPLADIRKPRKRRTQAPVEHTSEDA